MNEKLRLNVYMSGVGGQGIGVLSEVLLRAYDNAGFGVKGVDTHGLAQRGGRVESHLRVGYPGGNPLIESGCADIAVSLERTEAFRALTMLREGGTLVYYDTLWQSLGVRTGEEEEITADLLNQEAESQKIRVHCIHSEHLPDFRLQNISLIAGAVSENVLPGIGSGNIEAALGDLFSGELLKLNLSLLKV